MLLSWMICHGVAFLCALAAGPAPGPAPAPMPALPPTTSSTTPTDDEVRALVNQALTDLIAHLNAPATAAPAAACTGPPAALAETPPPPPTAPEPADGDVVEVVVPPGADAPTAPPPAPGPDELTLGLTPCRVCRQRAYSGRGVCMNVHCAIW